MHASTHSHTHSRCGPSNAVICEVGCTVLRQAGRVREELNHITDKQQFIDRLIIIRSIILTFMHAIDNKYPPYGTQQWIFTCHRQCYCVPHIKTTKRTKSIYSLCISYSKRLCESRPTFLLYDFYIMLYLLPNADFNRFTKSRQMRCGCGGAEPAATPMTTIGDRALCIKQTSRK